MILMSNIDKDRIRRYVNSVENKIYEKSKQKLSRNKSAKYQSLFDETEVAQAKVTLILLGKKNDG